MTDPNEMQSNKSQMRRLVMSVVVILLVVGATYVGFAIFFAADEPARVATPTDIGDPTAPGEGIGVPDGGDLTNVPTQAAPDSPARTMEAPEDQTPVAD